MNILYLTNHLNIGGISSYVLTLVTGLKRRGHNVYIASGGGKLLSKFIEEGAIYIPIPIKTKKEISPKILVSMFKLFDAVKQYNIDIAHSNSRTTQVLGCLLSRFTGMPYISTCHGFFKQRPLRRFFPCWGQKAIAISESVKEHLVRDFKVKEESIRVIHNGIDVEKFKNPSPAQAGRKNQKSKMEIKKELGLEEGQVVGIVARLSDVKGHIYLIEAMKDILIQLPKTQLLIVGEGKEKEELINLCKRLKIESSVFFIPEVYNTEEVLSIMDLFVMPSLKEGLGLSLMEAMACGLSVIGSNIGGIRSLIQDGHNGLLVEPRDTKGLTYAILELLRDPKKMESLGKAAQNFIIQNFSLSKMVLETEKVYLECLNEKYY